MLRSTDGREVALSSAGAFEDARREISELTGGSSGRGQFSYFFGLEPNDDVPTDEATRLSEEAAELQELFGDRLTPQTIDVLSQLAAFSHGPSGFGELLSTELAALGGRFADDELAFLALTSKVELPIRDRLAYALFQKMPGLLVAREWKRVDLAVLSRAEDPVPRMLLELKALYSFDLVGKEAWIRRYPEKIERDLAKLRALKDLPDAAELFALVLVTHPRVAIERHLWRVVKYSLGIGKAIRDHGDAAVVRARAKEALETHLRRLGSIRSGSIEAGEAYGVALDIDYWLIGPIDHTQDSRLDANTTS